MARHDGAAPPTAYPGRAAGRRVAAGPGPDVLREFRQRAIEAALRLSRQATGRPNIIVFHGGFHGRTVAAGTSGTKFRSGFSPLMAGVHVSPFPDPGHFGWPIEQATEFALAQLDYTLQTLSAPADTAAFFVEPVLGEGGYVPANQRFLEGLRERADAHGMLLVLDEVQTGFGRTGKFWPSAANRRGQARPDHRRARPWPDDRQRVSLRRRQTRRGNGGRRPTGGRPTRPVVADLRSVESGGPLHPALVVTAEEVEEAADIWADAVSAVVS